MRTRQEINKSLEEEVNQYSTTEQRNAIRLNVIIEVLLDIRELLIPISGESQNRQSAKQVERPHAQ